MIHELDLVVLNHEVSVHGLKSGDVGTVVLCYEDGVGYEVEFVTAEGKTLAVLTLTRAGIRPFQRAEILHAREVELQEVQRRLSGIDNGEVLCLPWEQVMQRLRGNARATD